MHHSYYALNYNPKSNMHKTPERVGWFAYAAIKICSLLSIKTLSFIMFAQTYLHTKRFHYTIETIAPPNFKRSINHLLNNRHKVCHIGIVLSILAYCHISHILRLQRGMIPNGVHLNQLGQFTVNNLDHIMTTVMISIHA